MISETTEHKQSSLFQTTSNYPEFRKLWLAQLVNNLGRQFTYIALQFLVYSLTESTLAMGILATCQLISMVTVGPYIGILIDRYDRKKLMNRSNFATAALLFCIPLTAFLPWQVIWIFGIAFLMGLSDRFFFPSRNASIPKLVAKKDLLSANSLSAATYQLMALIGPVVAGFLIHYFGYNIAFYIDMTGFLISALLISLISADLRPKNEEIGFSSVSQKRSVGSDIKESYFFLKDYVAFTWLIALIAFLIFGFGSSMILMIPYLHEIKNPFPPEEAFGFMLSFASVTGFSAAIYLGRRQQLPKPLTLINLASLLAAIIIFGFSYSQDVYMLAFCWLFFGMLETSFMIPFQVLSQETIPDSLRGKVFSVFNLIITVAQILGMGLGGLLADTIGIRLTLFINASIIAIASIVGFIILIMKKFEKDVENRRKLYLIATSEFSAA
ncbi:MAG: MFS transporter [Promethearchaeota archaeon]